MKNHVNFRPIKPSDYQALQQIICKTWSYEEFMTKKIAKRMSKLYLASCLMNQNFTCVALRGNEPVGIIMAKDKRKKSFSLRYFLRYVRSVLGVIVSKEGRKVASKFKDLESVDQKLLSQSKLHFDGELAFFVVRKDQRGSGVGKKLFDKCMEYMDGQNMKRFYLFTDSTCNVGFYKHQGLRQIGEHQYSLKPLQRGELQLYLYAANSPGRLCK